MNRLAKTPVRLLALGAAVAVVSATAVAPAFAAGGDVQVVNTETVQVYTSPTGKIESRRVYEQVALSGKGSVDLSNPISTSGLRNLDGFGGFDVKDGNQIIKTQVDGEKKLRSVSDYKGSLPLDVSVEYTLDGKTVSPGDVVGKSGKLEVAFTVENVTGKDQELTFPDGQGGTVTRTVSVPVPIVGSLSTIAPPNFTNVTSGQANMAGDGKGGTRMSFTMTLFPPIGTVSSTFGYTADITDGIVPRADITALPVNPLESPSFKGAATSYQGGADTGAELADGAATIDANLLKLRDGAAELLAGLIQLRDGAGALNTGLGQLDDGAKKLAAGAGDASAGSKKLDDGAGKLSDGLGQLNGGVGDLSTGGDQLAAGQKALAAGLKDLYDGVDTLPADVREQLKTNADYQRLLGTLDKIVAGIGDSSSTGANTLMGGLFQVRGGLSGIADGAQFMSSQLPAKKAQLNCAAAVLADLTGGPQAPGACFGGARPPLVTVTDPTTNFVVSGLSAQLAAGATSLDDLVAGLDSIKAGVDTQLIPGVNGLRKALYNADCNPAQTNPAAGDYCGIAQALGLVRAGVPALVDALTATIRAQLLAGIGRPTAGCDPTATLRCAAAALAAGGGELTAGIDKLVSGVTQLRAGGIQLADGAGQLSDGLGQLDDGAGQLSDGASKAADGSGQLSDGLDKAAAAAPQLPDGAQRLSDEGTKKLVEAGVTTAQNYGELYATMTAGAARAQTEDMALGAPEDSIGLTAYSYVIQGDDGEGGRNFGRAAGGLLLLAAGGGLFFLRRRFI